MTTATETKRGRSLPKKAGPQVQDAALSPRDIAIADYAAREACKLVIEECAKIADEYAAHNSAAFRSCARDGSDAAGIYAGRAVVARSIAEAIRARAAASVVAAEEQVRAGGEPLPPHGVP